MVFYLCCDEIKSYNNELLLCKKNQSLFLIVPVVNPGNNKEVDLILACSVQ